VAQWQWRDASGNRVFSDTPPPPHISDKQILRRPAGTPAPTAVATPSPAAPGGAAAPAAAAPGKAPAAKPTELDDKIKQAEEQKRKAEEQRVAKAKAENCQRARQAQSMLDSGQRISRANAQGERVFLDEKAIADERQQNRQLIAENCI